MRLRVSPTRMELIRLRRRHEIAVRGHRLLKQKLDGLLRHFRPLMEEYVVRRQRLDQDLPRALRRFLLARALSSAAAAEAALEACLATLELSAETEWVMSTPLPRLELRRFALQRAYSLLDTPPEFDRAVDGLQELLPLILEVATLEESLRRLALEIERTRRRVNALEYVLIPELAQAQRIIQSKLDELERSFRVQIMRVKDMLEAARRA